MKVTSRIKAAVALLRGRPVVANATFSGPIRVIDQAPCHLVNNRIITTGE